MNQTTLSMIRGQTLSFDVTIINSATGLPENLTNAQELSFTAKWDFIDSDANAVFKKTLGTGVTITNASQGIANITIAPGDTNIVGVPFTIINLNYDLKYIDSGGNVFVPLTGILNLNPNVTVT